MAQPLPYERDFDFAGFQSTHPSTPLPGDKVNLEFDQVAETFNQIRERIRILQRDDLELANTSVGWDQLKPELRNGFSTPTVWAAGIDYQIGASVYVGRKVYAALAAHKSVNFGVDLASGKWYLLADFTEVTKVDQSAVEAAQQAIAAAAAAQGSALAAAQTVAQSAASAQAAQNSAVAAAASQTAAATSASQAGISATNAASSASAASTSASNAASSATAAAGSESAAASSEATATAAAVTATNAATTATGAASSASADAASADADATAAANSAAAAALSASKLPNPSIADAKKVAVVKTDGSGYENSLVTDEQVATAGISASKSRYLASGTAGQSTDRPVIAVLEDYSNSIINYKNGAGNTPSGDGVTDQSTALSRCLAANSTAFIPPSVGGFLIGSTISVGSGKNIVGVPAMSKIKLPSGMSNDLFSLSGNTISVQNLFMVGDGSQTNKLFRFATALGDVNVVHLYNCWSDACYQIYSDDNAAGFVRNLFVEECTNTGIRSRGAYLNDCLAFIFFTRVTWDYVGITAASSNLPAVSLSNNEGAIFTNCDILGGTKTGLSSRDGFRIQNSRAVWFERCMADHMGGWGWYENDCDYVYHNICTSSLCDKDQYYVNTGSRWVTFNGCYAGGSVGESGATAGAHGLLVENSGPVSWTGGHMINNTGRGVATSGLASATQFIGAGISFGNNTAGNYALGNTSSHLSGCLLASGALLTTATNTNG